MLNTLFQVADLSLIVGPSRDNPTFVEVELHDSTWTPSLLYYLTLTHFALSTILILSYWHLKVRCNLMMVLAAWWLVVFDVVAAGSSDHLQAREAYCEKPWVEVLGSVQPAGQSGHQKSLIPPRVLGQASQAEGQSDLVTSGQWGWFSSSSTDSAEDWSRTKTSFCQDSGTWVTKQVWQDWPLEWVFKYIVSSLCSTSLSTLVKLITC